MEFYEPKIQPGWLISVAGLTGSGKTHVSNFFGDPKNTFFIDTHGTFSTVETLILLGQKQVWRTYEWSDLIQATKDFLGLMKKRKTKGTLVMDTASELVTMAQNFVMVRDNRKGIVNYAWGEVWKCIMAFLKMVVEAGHDLVLTFQLKREYEEVMDESGQKVSVWTGKYEAKQWKDLPYQCTCQLQLEHGLTYPGQRAAVLPSRVFTKLVKSRYAPVHQTKPYIVGQVTRENLHSQLFPYLGSVKECCWEIIQHPSTDEQVKKELKRVAGTVPEGFDLQTLKSTIRMAEPIPAVVLAIVKTEQAEQKKEEKAGDEWA